MEMQFKRFLSFVLALVMVLSYVPVSAFATDNATDNTTTSEETSQGSTTESSEAAEEPSTSVDDGIAVTDETDTTIDTMAELQTALATADSTITVGGILTVAEGESFDLNLNGRTVNMGNYYIENKGTLTITGGTLISTESNDETRGAPLYNHGGTLTVNGGTYTGVIAALRVEGGSAVIHDGTFEVTNIGDSTNFLIRMKGGSLTINGGTFTGNNAANSGGGCMIMSADGGTTTINGGTFTGFAGHTMFGTGTGVTVKGGSFDDQNSDGFVFASCIQGYVAENAIVTVNGTEKIKTEDGTMATVVAKIGDATYTSLADAVTAANAGDTIILNVSVDSIPSISKPLTIKGGVAGVAVNGAIAENFPNVEGTVTFENLTFNDRISTENNSSDQSKMTLKFVNCVFNVGSQYAIQGGSTASTPGNDVLGGLWIEGCTFNATSESYVGNYMVYAQCVNSLTIKNSTFNGNGLYKGAVHTGDSSEQATVATIEGNTINSVARGIQIGNRVEGSSVAVTGNTFTSVAVSANESKSGAIYVHSNADANAAVTVAGNAATSCDKMLYNDNNADIAQIVPTYENNTKDGAAIYMDSTGNDTTTVPGPVEVATEDELKEALANGGEIKLTADIDITARFTTTANATIDLNGKTLNIKVDEVNFSGCEVTIKNGTIDVSGVVATADAIFNIGKTNAATLTLDTVAVKGETYSSAFGVFYIRANSTLNINGGSVNLSGEQARYSYGATSGGVFKADGSSAALNITGVTMELYNVQKVITHATTAITNSNISIKGDAAVSDKMEHGINRSALTVTNSTITMENLYGRGITAENGAVSISENSTVTITNAQEATIDVRGNQTVTVDPTSSVTVDADPTITSGTISGEVTVKITPAGDITTGYVTADYYNTGKSGISGEAEKVVGTESFVVKLYSGETLVGTAALVDTNKVLLDGKSHSVSWHILATEEDDDSWWDTDWVTTLNVNNIPDKVELWVDGVLVDTGVVELNNTDLSYPICAAVTDAEGNIQSFVAGTGHLNAQTPPDYDEALQAALTAGGNIVMLRDVTVSKILTVGADMTLDLNGHTVSLPQLKIASDINVEVKNGSLVGTSASYDTIRSEVGDLTLTKVNVSGLRHTVRIKSGTAIIDGGTYTYGGTKTVHNTLHVINVGDDEDPENTKATVTIKGGTFIGPKPYAYDGGCAVKVQNGSTVTIEGGSFSNGVQTTLNADNGATLSITGGTYDEDPTAYVAEGYAALPNLNDQYVVGEKPTATVKDMGQLTVPAGDYMIYVNGDNTVDMPLNFVMQFLADQTEEDMETSPFADWYGDFVITFTGIENDSFIADGCYLAGHYGSFGWVKVPVDGMSIEEGVRYPVMLSVGMGQKYDYICSSVQDFKCALYLTPEILTANPNIKVTLELAVVDNSQGEEEAAEALVSNEKVYSVTDYTYDAEDFKPTVAKIGEVEYKSLDAAFAAVKSGDTITLLEDATMQTAYDVEDMTLTIDGTGTLDVNDKLTVHGESTLNISCPMASNQVLLGDGAILKDSTISGAVFVFGNVTFRGDNTVAMLYDFGTLVSNYGAEANMQWTVEPGASLTLTNTARYGLGYGDNVTIKGELEDALTARETLTEDDLSLFMHGISMSSYDGYDKATLTVEDAYVTIGSNSSFGTKNGNSGEFAVAFKNSVLDASRITVYSTGAKSTFDFTNTDAKVGTFMTRDADSVFTLTNSKLLSTTTTNGTDEGNYHAGKLVLTGSALTYSAPLVMENGTIELDLNSTITAPSITGTGKIVIDATGFTGEDVLVIAADMSGFTGSIEVKGAVYTADENGLTVIAAAASVTSGETVTYYSTLAEAIAAAKAGDTVTLLADISADAAIVIDKAITLDGDGHKLTSTATRAINVNCAGEVAIKNLTIATTNKTERAINVIQKAAELTLDNVTAEGFKYTINVASSSNGSNITINGGKFSGYAAMNITGDNTTVTADNVEFVGVNDASLNESNSYAVISIGDVTSPDTTDNVSLTVNGGKLTATSSNGNTQAALTVANSTKATAYIDAELVLVEGAVFIGNITNVDASFRAEYADELVKQGYAVKTSTTESMINVTGYVEACIGTTNYSTLQEAIAAAEAGETVILLADVTTMPESEVDKALTIKVDSHKLWLTNSLRALKAIAADGYTVKDNTDGAYTFEKVNTAVTGEASIGSTVYATLREAIEYAKDGAFIQILSDIVEKPATTISKSLVIVTNGYNLWNTADAQAAITEITDPAYIVETNWGMFFISAKPEEKEPVAKIGDVEYTSVQEALNAAKPAETVVMIADSDETGTNLLLKGGLSNGVETGVKLDLAGYTLTADGLTATRGADVIDSSAGKTGLLIVPQGSLALRPDNEQLPVWNESNGYVFVTPVTTNNTYQFFTSQNEDGFNVSFRPSLGYVNNELVRTKYLTNGGENNELTIKVKITWLRSDGTTAEQYFTYPDHMFGDGFNGLFTMSVTGISAINSMDFQVVLVSNTGVEFAGGALTYNK